MVLSIPVTDQKGWEIPNSLLSIGHSIYAVCVEFARISYIGLALDIYHTNEFWAPICCLTL